MNQNDRSPARKPFFSSRREFGLWLATMILVATLYSTLGMTSTLVGWLNQGTEALIFLICMGLIATLVLTQGLRSRPGKMELGVGLGIGIIYLMWFLRLTLAERSHLIEYSVIAIFIFEALRERVAQGRRVRFAALVAILASAGIGSLDECIQAFLPSRHFDPIDIVFNCLAALMAVLCVSTLSWIRQWVSRRSDIENNQDE